MTKETKETKQSAAKTVNKQGISDAEKLELEQLRAEKAKRDKAEQAEKDKLAAQEAKKAKLQEESKEDLDVRKWEEFARLSNIKINQEKEGKPLQENVKAALEELEKEMAYLKDDKLTAIKNKTIFVKGYGNVRIVKGYGLPKKHLAAIKGNKKIVEVYFK